MYPEITPYEPLTAEEKRQQGWRGWEAEAAAAASAAGAGAAAPMAEVRDEDQIPTPKIDAMEGQGMPQHMSRGDYHTSGINRRFQYDPKPMHGTGQGQSQPAQPSPAVVKRKYHIRGMMSIIRRGLLALIERTKAAVQRYPVYNIQFNALVNRAVGAYGSFLRLHDDLLARGDVSETDEIDFFGHGNQIEDLLEKLGAEMDALIVEARVAQESDPIQNPKEPRYAAGAGK
jgi:hypothetical protein